jgi:hypothetical protein
MRNVILVSILAVVLAMGAVCAYAGPPVNGIYKSSDGDFNEGREASSWPGTNGFLSPGNVLHALSYPKLGDDWKILCPTVLDTLLIFSTVSAGTGHMSYLLTYTGGYIELGGGGPWAGGDLVYTGVIDKYYETRSMQFVDGTMVGSVSDHSVDAHIVGYPASCVVFGIGNGVWLGSGANPGGAYPDYRDSSCAAGPTNGHWGEIRDLTLTVQGCEVSTERATWGAVKALYRD